MAGCGVSIVNSPSDVIGVALIAQGRDPNAITEASVAEAKKLLLGIRPSVRKIDSDTQAERPRHLPGCGYVDLRRLLQILVEPPVPGVHPEPGGHYARHDAGSKPDLRPEPPARVTRDTCSQPADQCAHRASLVKAQHTPRGRIQVTAPP